MSLVAYTSMSHADTATNVLAVTHRATEEYLRERGVPSVLLRDSWYQENYTGQLPAVLENGTVIGSAGQGRVSAEYAEAAAVVLTTEGHAGKVYELGGDEAFTLSELAAAISAASGKQITYTEMPAQKLAEVLASTGLPAEVADSVADVDLGLGLGELLTSSGDLRRLLGRPTTPWPTRSPTRCADKGSRH